MFKVLTLNMFFLFSMLLLIPSAPLLYAQDDDPFAISPDDWPDDPTFPDATDSEAPAAVSPYKQEAIPTPPQQQIQPVKTVTPTPQPQIQPKQAVTPSPQPIVSNTLPTYKVASTVKRAGPPRLLISRPVYSSYATEKNTKYIAAIAEAYFHFKLNALPGIDVIATERIANNIQYFRDFSRRISRTAYIDAAKKLGASYLFYQEYDPQGKIVTFNLELYAIDENKKLLSTSQELKTSALEDGLFDVTNEIASALIGTIPPTTQQFLAMPILGKNAKSAAVTLGTQIVNVGDYSKKRAEKAVGSLKKTVKANRTMQLARAVTAAMYARAGNYTRAIELQKQLIDAYGASYPALYLDLAAFYRKAELFSNALQATEQASLEPSLELLAMVEKARIYEANGDFSMAKKVYLSILQKGGEDGEVYFQLALVSIRLNDFSQASNYLEKAASAGRELDRGDYYELGLRYAASGTAYPRAIEAFKQSLGIQQDNEDAWQQLAAIYEKTGRTAEAAECYVSLFHINNDVYKELLPKAGFMYENSNNTEKAKDVYELFLARRYTNPQISVRLATLEQKSGNCPKAIELVDGMDTIGTYGTDIASINRLCGKQERRVVIPTNSGAKSTWFPVFLWRTFSTVATIGGIGFGYWSEMQVVKTYKIYSDLSNADAQNTAKVAQMHTDLKKYQSFRTIGYLAGTAGGISLGCAITLPIVLSSNK